MSQKPEASSGPAPDTCRYTTMAVLDGADARMSHSQTNRSPLTTKAAGTRMCGATLAAHRVWAATSTIEQTDVAINMAGSALKSSEVRNNASRVALPPTNWAVTAAAQAMAVRIDRVVVDMSQSCYATNPVKPRNGRANPGADVVTALNAPKRHFWRRSPRRPRISIRQATRRRPRRCRPSRCPTTGSPLAPGALFAGRYRMVASLGRGVVGEVWHADDLVVGTPVALKVIDLTIAESRARILEEVRLARRITHPAVCRVFDVGETEHRVFYSMELVDGEDAATLLRHAGHLPAEKVADIGRQLCDGLAAAHAQGALHRALKPANILIDDKGLVRITDFGIVAPSRRTGCVSQQQRVSGARATDARRARCRRERICSRSASSSTSCWWAGRRLPAYWTAALRSARARWSRMWTRGSNGRSWPRCPPIRHDGLRRRPPWRSC